MVLRVFFGKTGCFLKAFTYWAGAIMESAEYIGCQITTVVEITLFSSSATSQRPTTVRDQARHHTQ